MLFAAVIKRVFQESLGTANNGANIATPPPPVPPVAAFCCNAFLDNGEVTTYSAIPA